MEIRKLRQSSLDVQCGLVSTLDGAPLPRGLDSNIRPLADIMTGCNGPFDLMPLLSA